MKTYHTIVPAIFCVIAITVAVGCTPQAEETERFSWVLPSEDEGGDLPDVDPLKVTGNIQIAGSSTVFPLVEVLAARFNDEGYGGSVIIDSIGSGAGFERFCVAGESDIASASRPIQDKEVGSCQAIGREPIEIRVGADALVIVVNPRNDWIDTASVEELATLFTATNWNDLNSAWPDHPVERFVPGTDSGTFDYFVEEIFDGNSEPLLGSDNIQFSEDDNVLVRGIAGSTYAVGFFGYAYATNNPDSLKVLDIEQVTPSGESVNDASYPLSRPLFMYSDATIIAERPQVGAFMAYVLNYVQDEIREVGYFPAVQSDVDSAKEALVAVLRNAGAIE